FPCLLARHCFWLPHNVTVTISGSSGRGKVGSDAFVLDRRALMASAAALGLLSGCGAAATEGKGDGFICREGKGFTRHGAPYRFTGANAWYLAWLGADAHYGDRARLVRELDRLKALGLTNLRIMAS